MMYDSISQTRANQVRQIRMENITIRKGSPEDADAFEELLVQENNGLLRQTLLTIPVQS